MSNSALKERGLSFWVLGATGVILAVVSFVMNVINLVNDSYESGILAAVILAVGVVLMAAALFMNRRR